MNTKRLINNLKHDKRQLEDKYFHLLLNTVQKWINANPDYKIYAGMGVWFLEYKGHNVDGGDDYILPHEKREFTYLDEDHDTITVHGGYESFKPISELIQRFEAEGVYLGQNVEPQKGS